MKSQKRSKEIWIIIFIIWFIWLVLLITSCDSKPKEESLYTFEMTLVTGKIITETYRLEKGVNDFYIGTHYGSYWLGYYDTDGSHRSLRSAVIDFKLLKIEPCSN